MTNAMTVPADEIRGLIEERERYEGWLTALEARRGATPGHVFDRVRADYDTRLQGVRDRLAEHVRPLQAAEADLARRHDEVSRSLGERQDQLAELELRTLVGEFAADEGERRVQEAAAAVRELDGTRRSTSEELTELRALLQRAGGSPSGPSPEAPVALTGEIRGPAASAPEPAGPAAPAERMAERAAPSGLADAFDAAARDELSSLAATTSQAAQTGQSTPAADRRAAGWPSGQQVAGAADDESFVGTGQRLDALAASLGGAVAPPPAASGAGQERTLRCQDCGEMNYPTEWYCERCGGELAAM